MTVEPPNESPILLKIVSENQFSGKTYLFIQLPAVEFPAAVRLLPPLLPRLRRQQEEQAGLRPRERRRGLHGRRRVPLGSGRGSSDVTFDSFDYKKG